MRRGALGLQVTATGSVRDSLGVFVTHVNSKGPAENAGIIEGDRIVSINGVDLRLSAADAADTYTSGLPSHRLSREVGKLTPGGVANVRVYSAGRVRDVRVIAGRASDLMTRDRAFGFGFDGLTGAGNTFMYRTAPGMHNVRPENFTMPRMRIETRPRPEMLERLEELRLLSPSRVVPRSSRIRILEDGGEGFMEADTVIYKRSDRRDAEKGAVKPKKK